MSEIIRKAAFAGRFYPENKEELTKLLNFMVKIEEAKINTSLSHKNIIGAVVPHAGYIYSGYHAVHVYELIKLNAKKYDTVVIINPNHTRNGRGKANVSLANYWETPLGNVETDKEFSQLLGFDEMNETISHEHSGEVQIPMLQHFMNSSFKIVMLTMNIQNPETAHLLAEKIFQAQKFTSRRILVLASCDFSHFEDVETGFKQDQFLIDQILEMNTEEMFNKVKKHNISACGYGPIMTLIEYSKKVAKKPKIELLRRGHSGEISHSDKVVDYASFLCFE